MSKMLTRARSKQMSETSSASKMDYSYSHIYDTKDDRKSLDQLCKILENLPNSPPKSKNKQNSKSNSSKYRQLSIVTFCPNSFPNKNGQTLPVAKSLMQKPANNKSSDKRKKKAPLRKVSSSKIRKSTKNNNSSAANLDDWLGKMNNKYSENCTEANVCQLRKNSSNSKKLTGRNKQVKETAREMFAKYGMCIESFEDIVAAQSKMKKRRECLDNMESKMKMMELSQVSLELNIDEPQTPEVVLDCKHLTKKEIKKAFKRNYDYVYEIFHGKRYSIRHQRFNKVNHADQFTTKDLKYNASMSVFTFDQKQQLLTHLQNKFDGVTNISSNNQYFFKVLLPELCTKIFMDVHGMSYEEAMSYLETSPV